MKYERSAFEWATDIVLYLLLGIIAFTTLYPFIYLLALSFNDPQDTLAGGIYFYPGCFQRKTGIGCFPGIILSGGRSIRLRARSLRQHCIFS